MTDYVPFFTSASDVLNNFGTTFDSVYIDDEYDVYVGASDKYVFALNDDQIIRRYDITTGNYIEVTMDFSGLKGTVVNFGHVVTGEDTSIYIVHDYDSYPAADSVSIVEINWDTQTSSLKNSYAYVRTSSYTTYGFMGAAKYNGNAYVVLDFTRKAGALYQADFLIYRDNENEFELVVGPSGVNDNYLNQYKDSLYFLDGYADLGNGFLGILLESFASVLLPTTLSDSYLYCLDVVNGSGLAVTLPKSTNNPLQSEDYAFDIATYYSIAPDYTNGYFLVQGVYKVYNGASWDSITRIYSIETDGTLDIVNDLSFETPPDWPYVFKLLYSKNKIVSIRYVSGDTVAFYNVTDQTSMFSKSYSDTLIFCQELNDSSSDMYYIDAPQAVDTQMVAGGIGDWAQDDVPEVYGNGWTWDHWAGKAASLSYEVGYSISGTPRTGILISASSNDFTDDMYVAGDLVVDIDIDAKNTSPCAVYLGSDYLRRYMITSTNTFVSNNAGAGVNSSGFNINSYPGYYGYGLEDGSPLKLTPVIPNGYVRDSGDGIHAEAFFFSSGCANVDHGDQDIWVGDNEGYLNLQIYNADVDYLELAAKVDLDGVAIVGTVFSATTYATGTGATQFARVVFTDGTYIESAAGSTSVSLTTEALGKELSKYVVGVYFGTLATTRYRVDMVITSFRYYYLSDFRYLKKIAYSGGVQTVGNIDLLSVTWPVQYYGSYLKFLGGTMFIPKGTYGGGDTLVLYSVTGSAINLPQIIWWQ